LVIIFQGVWDHGVSLAADAKESFNLISKFFFLGILLSVSF
jgi:hypothetical protein